MDVSTATIEDYDGSKDCTLGDALAQKRACICVDSEVDSYFKSRKFSAVSSLFINQSNYSDDVNLAVAETVAKLIDTSKVIELEHVDLNQLPKRYIYIASLRDFLIS